MRSATVGRVGVERGRVCSPAPPAVPTTTVGKKMLCEKRGVYWRKGSKKTKSIYIGEN